MWGEFSEMSWGEERFDMRKKAMKFNVQEHQSCKECGSKPSISASWMWGGIKGKNKAYLVRCPKHHCSYLTKPFWGDTPEEAMQQWDEEMTKKHTFRVTYDVVNQYSVDIAAETEEEAREIFSNRKKEQSKLLPEFSALGRPDCSSTDILTVEDMEEENRAQEEENGE